MSPVRAAMSAAADSTAPAGQRSLAQLARSVLGAGQGVYVEAADGTVLLAQQVQTAVNTSGCAR